MKFHEILFFLNSNGISGFDISTTLRAGAGWVNGLKHFGEEGGGVMHPSRPASKNKSPTPFICKMAGRKSAVDIKLSARLLNLGCKVGLKRNFTTHCKPCYKSGFVTLGFSQVKKLPRLVLEHGRGFVTEGLKQQHKNCLEYSNTSLYALQEWPCNTPPNATLPTF